MYSLVTLSEAFRLETSLLHLVNDLLPELHLSPVDAIPVTIETPLFEKGRIDSMAILHVIGLIEDHTGAPVPDELVSMKHFYSIGAICRAFYPPLP